MFTRRKPILIPSPGIAKVTLPHEPNIKSDFSDVRFYGSDETTLLDYSRNSYTSNTTADFYVDAQDTNMYAYFGDNALNYSSSWFPEVVLQTIGNHSTYVKDSANPFITNATSDHYMVYAPLPYEEAGTTYIFYAANENVGNPHIQGNIWLVTTTDHSTFTNVGMIIDRDSVPDLGISPFSIQKISGTYYLFLSIYNNGATIYKMGYMTSTDLLNWSGFTYLTGVDSSSHAPCVIEDPADNTKLIMYYTGDVLNTPLIRRATALKSNPASWSNNATALSIGSAAIYPWVTYNGDHYEMMFIKLAASGYVSYKTASKDGLTFPNSALLVLPPGGSGQFDSAYVSTPKTLNNRFYYCGRMSAAQGAAYVGIGFADLTTDGGLMEWHFSTGNTGTSTTARTGTYGGTLIGGATNPSVSCVAKGKNKIYEVWIYDDMITTANFQNTFRLVNSVAGDCVLGLWMGASTTKYIYRKNGGSWTASTINRSSGWHKLSFEVTDDVIMKIDNTVVGTDTVFNTDDLKSFGMFGYSAGTGYFDDCRVLDLDTVPIYLGTEVV